MKADEHVAGKESEDRKEKSEAAITNDRARKQSHSADGCEIPGMGSDAQGGGEGNDGQGEQRTIKQIFFLRELGIHVVAFSISKSISQKTKPSRLTISPVRMGMGE